jgi:hypothetical protein
LDALHSLLFYVLSAVAIAGGLAAAILPSRAHLGLGLAVAGVGVGGLLVVLSAALAGLVLVISLAACGIALSGRGHRVLWDGPAGRWEQAGAVASGLLLLLLLYAAWRADFFSGAYPGGSVGAAAVARLLLAHDGLAGDSLALLALVASVGAGLFWRARVR